MRNCYTYLIGWSKNNTYYYGRQTRLGCDPSNFWKSYFTSSLHVAEYRNLHGEPDIIQIRKIFGEDYIKCSNWETTVLTKMNCAKNPVFLNRTNNSPAFAKGTTGIAPAFDINGEYLGLVNCNDISWGKTIFGSNKFNENLSKQTRERNLAQVGEGIHPFQGDSNPSRKKVKAGTHHWLKENNSPQRQAIDDLQRSLVANGTHHWLGTDHAEKTSIRTKHAIALGEHPCGIKDICPHCKKEGQLASMKRWHFDNCVLVLNSEQLLERHQKNLENGRKATTIRMKKNKL
jgi:hypothetical protein